MLRGKSTFALANRCTQERDGSAAIEEATMILAGRYGLRLACRPIGASCETLHRRRRPSREKPLQTRVST